MPPLLAPLMLLLSDKGIVFPQVNQMVAEFYLGSNIEDPRCGKCHNEARSVLTL